MKDVDRDNEDIRITGKYAGQDPTDTEKESADEIEVRRRGPINPGDVEYRELFSYRHGEGMSAYEASRRAHLLDTGKDDGWHITRREATRLVVRGFLYKTGEKVKDPRPASRKVDVYEITEEGYDELVRLRELSA